MLVKEWERDGSAIHDDIEWGGDKMLKTAGIRGLYG